MRRRIDNAIMSNGMTRCWDRNGVYDVPTDPKSKRPIVQETLYQPPEIPADRMRIGVMGATQGWKARTIPWHELVEERK